MDFILLANTYSILKFPVGSALPIWIYSDEFYSITRTSDELSVVTRQTDDVTEVSECDKDWRILKIDGILNFSIVGIMAEITAILKEKEIPVFVISTYNTDYFLIKQPKLDKATLALKNMGHHVLL